MKKLVILFFLVINLLSIGALVPTPAKAAIAAGCENSRSFLGLPPWYAYLDVGPKGQDNCAVIGPADKDGHLDWGLAAGRIGLAIIEILLRISAVVAVGFVFFGGVSFVLSEGDPEKTNKSRETVYNSIIGLLIVLAATAIVNLVGGTLAK